MGDFLTPISGSEPNLVLGCNLLTDATDVSPSGLTPSIVGSPTFGANGAFLSTGNYITFPGNIGNYGDNIRFNGSFSSFFWITKSSALASIRFLTKGTAYIHYFPSTFFRSIINGAIYNEPSGDDLPIDGLPHQIGFVVDTANGVSTYIDGSLIGKSGVSTVTPADVSTLLEIGAISTGSGIDASMKGLELYNVAFTNQEVLDLYNLRNTSPVPNAPENVDAYTTVGVDGAIFVSWSAPSAGSTPDTYNLYYSTTSPVTTGDSSITGLVIGDSQKIIIGLTPGAEVFVAMSSVYNSLESVLSTEDSATPTGTAPDTPVITTISQTVNYNGYGNIAISGTCGSAEQLIKLQKNGADISPAIYVPISQGTFNAVSIPVTSGSQTFTAKGCSINLCSSASNSITITGVDTAVTQETANLESIIYNGLKTILVGNSAINIDTIIYNGEERVMPCIEIDLIEEYFRERFSCYDMIDFSFQVRCLTRDNYNFVSGQFDDTGLSDSKEGSASIAYKVRTEILSDYQTSIPKLTYLQHDSTTKFDQDAEITGYVLNFSGYYNRARV